VLQQAVSHLREVEVLSSSGGGVGVGGSSILR
jgi:hypothetical protein